jgi:hypothetical protein
MAMTVKADILILEYAVATYHDAFQKSKHINNILFSITFEPVPLFMIKDLNAPGPNAPGLKPSDGSLVMILFYNSWDEANNTNTVYEVNQGALKRIEIEAERRHVAALYRFYNYSFTHQDPIGSYGEESKKRLQVVSVRYDPEVLFSGGGR